MRAFASVRNVTKTAFLQAENSMLTVALWRSPGPYNRKTLKKKAF
jgi:hypothetical protein